VTPYDRNAGDLYGNTEPPRETKGKDDDDGLFGRGGFTT